MMPGMGRVEATSGDEKRRVESGDQPEWWLLGSRGATMAMCGLPSWIVQLCPQP